MATTHYIDRARVRTELGLAGNDTGALSDVAADRLIRLAEALVDRALGPYAVHDSGAAEGRKIASADVDGWRYAGLQDATAALAARLHLSPDLIGARFESVSGPDFSYSGPIGPVFGSEISALLDGTGLVIRGARARP